MNETILDAIQEPAVSNFVDYGSFLRRFAAMFIDGIILQFGIGIISTFFTSSMVNSFGNLGPNPDFDQLLQVYYGFISFFSLTVVAGWLYSALLESSKHQATIGKVAMKLVVTDLEGKRISFGKATGRHFAKLLSSIFFIGYLMALFTSRNQGLHDKLAGALIYKTK
ncbi:MAG: RDD family protein [Bacteroidota bacterium]